MKFNILKKVNGSGSTAPKNKFAYIAHINDIRSFPKADHKGVALTDDIIMKDKTGMSQIYITPIAQEYTYDTAGDSDSKNFKLKFIGTHPGTELEALEFAKNYLEEGFVVLIPSCEAGLKVLGTPDAPLVFTSSHKSDKESQKFIFTFEQEIGTENVYQLYTGLVTLNENIDVDMGDFLETLKSYMKLDGTNLTEAQKQNLRTILGTEAKNIGNEDLSLNDNRVLNLGNHFFNFFSSVGARIGINKNNPNHALEVGGNIKTDGLIISDGGSPKEVGSICRNGNEIQFKTATGWETIMLKGDYISDSHGVIAPDTQPPVGGWKIGWYTPKVSSVVPGTNYPNQNNLKSVEGFFTEFYFNGEIWIDVANKYPETQFIPSFSGSTFPLISSTSNPIQRTYNNIIWELTPGQTAQSTDIPGVSNKWYILERSEVKDALKLFTHSKNLFDKSTVITGNYIDATTGNLATSATSAVSAKIPVTGGTTYFLSGKNDARTEVKFYDINNVAKKPVNADTGVELASFVLGYQNGRVRAPIGAVSFQMTVKFLGVGTFDVIQFELGSLQTSYQPYGYSMEELNLVKEEVDDVNLIAVNANNKIDTLISGGVLKRENTGENTSSPIYFGTTAGNSNSMKIDLVNDNTLPFYEALPFKRVMSYPLTGSPSSVYNNVNLQVQSRPTHLTVSYWARESELRAIYDATNMQVYMGLASYVYNIINLLNNIGITQTVTLKPSISEYTQGVLTVYVNNKIGDYVQIVQDFKLTWKPDFIGTTIPYYFIFNGVVEKVKVTNFTVYNFTYLKETINKSVLIYADPLGSYGQSPQNLSSIQNQIEGLSDKIDSIDAESGKECRVQIINEDLFFASPFSSTQELSKRINIKRLGGAVSNPNVNLVSALLISKGGSLDSGTVVKNSGDDICPVNLNGSYIGGNHGWNQPYVLTLNAHGKTFADIGSKWKNSANVIFTILRIVDANTIWICSDNQNTNGYGYTFITPSGTLNYVSNGVNTGDITGYTTVSIGNLYNTVVSNKRKVLVDGKTEYPSTSGIIKCTSVDIVEDYDILDLPSVINSLTANRPTGGYTSNVDLNTVGGIRFFNHTITYRLLSNGVTLTLQNFFTYRKYNLNFHGFIQAGAISGSLYIPKVLPISDGVKTWDFRKVENWNPYPAQGLFFTPQYWENPQSPPDRLLNFNSNINFHMGYLFDRGVGKLRRENPTDWLSQAIFLNTTGKLYPFGVNKGGVNMEANTFLSCVAFRHFSNPANNPTGRLNYTYYELNGKVFMYLDYKGSIEDKIIIPQEWQGKKIVVNEKTSNVVVLGEITTNELRVNCLIDSSNFYGYCVLTLE